MRGVSGGGAEMFVNHCRDEGVSGGGAEMFVNHCRDALGCEFSYLEWCAVVTTKIRHPLCTKIYVI